MSDIWRSTAAFMASPGAQNWIALVAVVVAFLSYLAALLSFQSQKRRDRRVRLQENYLRLELESNAVFRYEAEHGDTLDAYKALRPPVEYQSNAKNDSIADQFYLQQLNLFEIATRFRRSEVFEAAVFGSWVAWFFDVACSWWFRRRWLNDYSPNYTVDLYRIFQPCVTRLEQIAPQIQSMSEEDRAAKLDEARRAFFVHVGAEFGDKEVINWFDRPTDVSLPLPAGSDKSNKRRKDR